MKIISKDDNSDFIFETEKVNIFLDSKGESWFVAKDVSKVLGYSRTNKMLERLDSDEKITIPRKGASFIPIDLFGNQGSLTLINESGLYNGIFGSKLPLAKKFKKWVTSEVLPSIRKTGSYSLKTETPDLQSIRERGNLITVSKNMFLDFQVVFHEIGIKREEELIVTANRAVKKETGVDFIQLAELKGVSTPVKYFTVTELCQKVMDSDNFSDESKKLLSTKAGDKPRPQNLNKILESNGFQEKVDGVWKPTEKAKDLANFVQNKSKYSEKTVFHTVWKIEVLDKII